LSDRGEYRPFFGSILDDPDFQAMPGDDFKVLFALKLLLGPAGIGVPRLLSLAEAVGRSPDELAESLALLERPKPGEEYGWILRERNIVWIVNGLRHELLKPNNHPHKKRIAMQVQALGNKPIVRLFRSYYHEWFDQPTPSIDGPKREPKGSLEGVSRHKSESETKRDETKSETETGTIEGAQGFLDRFYRDATPARRAEVEAQIYASLSPAGARLRGNDHVLAKNRAHLERCIARTMAETIRIPDRAIVVLLKKLQDEEKNERGRYPGEANVDRDKAVIAKENAYDRARRAAANDWSKDNPDELERLKKTAWLNCPAKGELGDVARNSWLLQEISKRNAFPDYETWLSGQVPIAATA
jgi:hypothetical protein